MQTFIDFDIFNRGTFVHFEDAAKELDDIIYENDECMGIIDFDILLAELLLENESIFLHRIKEMFARWFAIDYVNLLPYEGEYTLDYVTDIVKSMMNPNIPEYVREWLPKEIYHNMKRWVKDEAKRFIRDIFDIQSSYDNFSIEISAKSICPYQAWAYNLIKGVVHERRERHNFIPEIILRCSPPYDYDELVDFDPRNHVKVVYTDNISDFNPDTDHFALTDLNELIIMDKGSYFTDEKIPAIEDGAIPDLAFDGHIKLVDGKVMLSDALIESIIQQSKAMWAAYRQWDILHTQRLIMQIGIYCSDSLEQAVSKLLPTAEQSGFDVCDLVELVTIVQQEMMKYVMEAAPSNCTAVLPHEVHLLRDWHINPTPVPGGKGYLPQGVCFDVPDDMVRMMLESAHDNGYCGIQLRR